MSEPLWRRVAAEFVGSLLLTGVVIGSGILASRLAGGNDAVALLGNTGATAAILFVLITALGPISGAHFNPAVTLVMTLRRALSAGDALSYVVVQIAGCVAGAILAHAMFELPLVQVATHARAGFAQDLICAATKLSAAAALSSRRSVITNVTAGLKCAPETGPSAVISTNKIAAVAPVLPSNATASLPPANRDARIPEPITTPVSNSEPTNSAVTRRHNRSLTQRPPDRPWSRRYYRAASAATAGRAPRSASS